MTATEYVAIARYLHPKTGKQLHDGDILEALKDRDARIRCVQDVIDELRKTSAADDLDDILAALESALEPEGA